MRMKKDPGIGTKKNIRNGDKQSISNWDQQRQRNGDEKMPRTLDDQKGKEEICEIDDEIKLPPLFKETGEEQVSLEICDELLSKSRVIPGILYSECVTKGKEVCENLTDIDTDMLLEEMDGERLTDGGKANFEETEDRPDEFSCEKDDIDDLLSDIMDILSDTLALQNLGLPSHEDINIQWTEGERIPTNDTENTNKESYEIASDRLPASETTPTPENTIKDLHEIASDKRSGMESIPKNGTESSLIGTNRQLFKSKTANTDNDENTMENQDQTIEDGCELQNYGNILETWTDKTDETVEETIKMISEAFIRHSQLDSQLEDIRKIICCDRETNM